MDILNFLTLKSGQALLPGWKQLFPAKLKTELESLTFTKKLMSATISNILFVRNIFRDDDFAKKSLDGVPLRILREKSSDPRVKSFANWLLGAFDALKKKYLKALTMVILLDPTFPEVTHEAYTIKVSYPGGLPTCEVLGELGQVQNSTRDLLEGILMLTETLDPLPETAYLALRLAYYDENTPADYEPHGFQSAEKELILPASNMKVKVGKVSTIHHSLSVRIHARPGASSQQEQFLNDQFMQSQLSQLSQEDDGGSGQVKVPERRLGHQVGPIAEEDEEMIIEEEEGRAEDPVPIAAVSASISCSCGSQQQDAHMLLCKHCRLEQHSSCYKILPGDPLPFEFEHCCLPCSLEEEGRVCTDVKLVKIANEKGMRLATNTMMFRRVLVNLDASNLVSQQSLLDLGLSRVLVESIEQKLRQDGVIEEEGSVNGSALEKAKQKYFGRRASKRSRDEEEIENMSRAADELHIGDQVLLGGGDGEGRDGDGGQGGRGHPGAAGDAEGQGHGRKRRKVSRARGE